MSAKFHLWVSVGMMAFGLLFILKIGLGGA